MGNFFETEQAQRSLSPVDILGEDTTSRPDDLTVEDHMQIDDNQHLFEAFYNAPSIENYQRVRSMDQLYLKGFGQKYQLYLWAIRSTFDLEDPLTEEEEMDYTLELDRLLDQRNFLTAADLDKLWTLYYATGDSQFPNRVKKIALNPLCHQIVRGAAKWSYSSHVQSGKLVDPEWKCSDGTADIAEYISEQM